jgi:hypothetical protein
VDPLTRVPTRHVLLVLLALAVTGAAAPEVSAQTPWEVPLALPDETVLNLDRPRIAGAPDGSFAVAVEIYTQGQFESSPRWKVAVQRYSPEATPVGPTNVFVGESCSTLDIWLFDWMEHVELAFRPDGILLVLMQHAGRFSLGSVDDVASAEVTLGAIDAQGQIIRLTNRVDCVQHKLIFPSGGRQDRPRMAMAPNGGLIVTADGFFNRSSFRSVALRVLDASLNELVEQAIPHADPGSQVHVHRESDIATNGSVFLSVWHQCRLLDVHGNTEPCDVAAQFGTIGEGGALFALGGNLVVNAGDPPGTWSLWPSAAMNASGNSVVVWADTRTAAHGEIFGQRFDASGQRVGGNFQVSAGEGTIWNRPEVALLDDGRFMVGWTDSSAAGFNARGREYAATGTPLGPPVRLMDRPGAPSGLVHVAAQAGRFLYTYLGVLPGERPRVFANVLATPVSGAPEGPPEGAVVTLSNFPNPFRHRTTITFELREPGPVRLTLVEPTGREVLTLFDGVRPGGVHEVAFDAGSLPGGLYLYRLEAEGATRTGRLTLLR